MVNNSLNTMSINQAIVYGNKIINDSCVHSNTDARLLLAYVLGCDKLYLTVNRDKLLTHTQQNTYGEYLKRRASGEPLSYITGKKEFMSLDFKVNKSVLIPRPETEHLVELALQWAKDRENPKILDLCTGSGAIAVSLAHYLKGEAHIHGADISDDALKVAKTNADLNNANVRFFIADALSLCEIPQKYDAVISNPPYIETDIINTLDANVKNFEPHLALDGGSDGLVFYKSIIKNARKILNTGGLLALEIGCNQGESVKNLMADDFCGVEIKKDLAGLDRIVYGYLKED